MGLENVNALPVSVFLPPASLYPLSLVSPPSYFYLSLFFRTSSESLCAELNPVSRLGSVCFEDDLSEE